MKAPVSPVKQQLNLLPFDSEYTPGARNAVNVCLRIQANEKVTVITDEATKEIAASIVLMIVAIDMLRAQRSRVQETKEETTEGTRKTDIAVTPLAVPMLAGPGAISTVPCTGLTRFSTDSHGGCVPGRCW